MTEQRLRDRVIERWLKPPWEWRLNGAFAVLILVAIVLLIERDRIVSIQIGATDGVSVAMAFRPPEAFTVPGPGQEVEISADISGLGSITEPSACRLIVEIPESEPIRTGPEAVGADGRIEWSIPSDAFPSIGEVPVTADVIATCDVDGEEFVISTELDFVSQQ